MESFTWLGVVCNFLCKYCTTWTDRYVDQDKLWKKWLKKRSGHPPHNGVKIFLKLYMNFYLNFHISAHSVLIGTKKLLLQSESSITIWSTVAKIKISDPSHIISFLLSSSVFLTVHRELTRLRKLTFKVEASLYFLSEVWKVQATSKNIWPNFATTVWVTLVIEN